MNHELQRNEIGKRSIPVLMAGSLTMQAVVEDIFNNRVEYMPDDGSDQMVLSYITKQVELYEVGKGPRERWCTSGCRTYLSDNV